MSEQVAELAPFRIYVGWDPSEASAYDVCRHSIKARASVPVEIHPLKLDELRVRGLYSRTGDPLAATEFTYSRFLTPHLAGYEGWALFCDCDFLWLTDIAELIALIDDRYAVMCVHLDHRPKEDSKMEGAVQTRYPRKNWSSMVLYNCGHPANRALTAEVVNRETGAFLHRFQWLEDDLIGSVPETWNWLEGWSDKPKTGHPNVIHYTRGGPWFENWREVDYADLWLTELEACKNAPA
ncbi:MAG: glycosyltransferase [Rhodospirillales bacterium]|nr:glycosyltransferase [Rhodospirillales bacterium]